MPEPRERTVRAGTLDVGVLEMGSPGDPLVLLLHGFPDHPRTWRHLAPRLADAGFHVVAPALRGYHPTGPAPDGVYLPATLALDAVAVAEAVAPGASFHVVGHDWGAVAALGAGALEPTRVRGVVALSVPHPAVWAARLVTDMEQARRSWYFWFFQLPFVPEMALAAPGGELVDLLWRTWSPGLMPDPGDRAALHTLFARPDTGTAAVEYYRQTVRAGLDPTTVPEHLRATQATLLDTLLEPPTAFVGGTDDGCFDCSNLALSRAHCSGPVRVEVLDGAGHFVHLERPDEVAAIVLEALGRPSRVRTLDVGRSDTLAQSSAPRSARGRAPRR